MFTLDQPLTALAPLAGGGGNLPPITTPKRFAPTSGFPKPPAMAKNNATPVIIPAAKYPKPRVWVDNRIAICERHHARWLKWRAANTARLQAWVESQPGYDPALASRLAYESKLRRAFKARNPARA